MAIATETESINETAPYGDAALATSRPGCRPAPFRREALIEIVSRNPASARVARFTPHPLAMPPEEADLQAHQNTTEAPLGLSAVLPGPIYSMPLGGRSKTGRDQIKAIRHRRFYRYGNLASVVTH